MKILLESNNTRWLSLEREDILEAVTNGMQWASISPYGPHCKVIRIDRDGAHVSHPVFGMLFVAFSRFTDMHVAEEVAA